MKLTKAVALEQLQTELQTAGVPIRGLGTSGTLKTNDLEIHTYDAEGVQADLPQAASAVIAAHTPPPPPPPIDYGTDAPPDYANQVAGAVTNLRAYLAASSPTVAQNAAALKLVIRILLFMLRRMIL